MAKSVFYKFIQQLSVVCGTCVLLLTTGCSEQNTMPGDIASLNERNFSFREVEARRVLYFTGLSSQVTLADDATLQKQYLYIIRQLMEEELVCQYMKDKGLELEPGRLEEEEARIRQDFPDGSFDAMLITDGISLDVWRDNLYKRLLVQQFIDQVLRKDITITPQESKEYYRNHSNDFIVPEQWHFLQIAGNDRKEVADAGKAFITSKNATNVQKEFTVTIHDISMDKDRLPDTVVKELTPLAVWKASPIKIFEDEYRLFVLIEKKPEAMLDDVLMYKRVEQALVEEKLQPVYSAWLRKRFAKSTIRLSPALLKQRDANENEALVPALVQELVPAGQNGTGQNATTLLGSDLPMDESE